MSSTSRTFGRLLLGLAAVASLLTACNTVGPSGPQPSECGDIPADIGGCSSSRPVYVGTTCEEVATEWARAIDRLVTVTFAEPSLADGKLRSARIQDALVLSSITAGMRLAELGLLGTCAADAFVATAEPLFSDGLRAEIPAMLYDDAPTATWDQFLFEIRRAIKIIDVAASPSPAGQ